MVGEISTCCGYDADQTMATGCPCQWELIADKAVKAGYPHVDVLRVGDDYLVSRRSASRTRPGRWAGRRNRRSPDLGRERARPGGTGVLATRPTIHEPTPVRSPSGSFYLRPTARDLRP